MTFARAFTPILIGLVVLGILLSFNMVHNVFEALIAFAVPALVMYLGLDFAYGREFELTGRGAGICLLLLGALFVMGGIIYALTLPGMAQTLLGIISSIFGTYILATGKAILTAKPEKVTKKLVIEGDPDVVDRVVTTLATAKRE